MSKKIFQSHFVLAMAVLLLCFLLFAGGLYRNSSQQERQGYEMEVLCLAKAIENSGTQILKDVQGQSSHRVTLFNQNAAVLFDSAGRGEDIQGELAVRDALSQGKGESESMTLTSQVIHIALRLNNGMVLCVSGVRDSVLAVTMDMLFPFLMILVLGGILSAYLSGRVLQWMIEPVGAARLETLEDLCELEEQDVCEELKPLIHRVAEQNRQAQRQLQKQMNEWKREYEKQDRMRRDFTANVSHELKTPLTSISGYAEILREGLVKSEDVGRFAGKIYEEAQRLIALVGDILKLSQLEDGRQVRMDKVQIDLYQTCERSMFSLQSAAEQRNVSMALSGLHLQIRGTEKVIDEIVYNLCDNAVKYNKVGGHVDISVTEENGQVLLRVKDSGIGIAAGEVERIFERFYCVDKSHSKEIGGTGLGLSIVKHGVAYHNAELQLNSTLGEGTEICIRFPQS